MINNNIKVSVIIPCYNAFSFLPFTIESVFKQTYKNFELIVIDDGSTDESLKYLESLTDKIVLIKQKNKERASARNAGIIASKGEYIAFLDADDLWLETKLEGQVNILDNNENIDCVYSSCGRVDENNFILPSAKRQTKGYSGDIYHKLILRNFIPSPTPLIRKKIIEKVCINKNEYFETQYKFYEDWAFWLKISCIAKFYFIPKILALYRIHPKQSISNTNISIIANSTFQILNNSFKFNNVSLKLKNKALAHANIRIAYWYLIKENYVRSLFYLKRAFKMNKLVLFKVSWLVLFFFNKFPILNKLYKLSKLHNKI